MCLGLQVLNAIGAIGDTIVVGTDYNNTAYIYDLDVYEEESVVGFSIHKEDNQELLRKFKNVIGKNNISVSLTTRYDLEHGDIFDREVLFDDMINEAIKIIQS